MSERREIAERLQAIRLTHNMHPNPTSRLVAIARAVMPDPGWPTIAWCHDYRDKLVSLLEDADAEVDAVRSECSEMLDRIASDSVPLPCDANGNVLHIGDMVTGGNRFFRKYKSLPVECLAYDSNGWKVWVCDPQFGCGYDFGCKEVQVVRREKA